MSVIRLDGFIFRASFKGEQYTLHIQDATGINGDCIIDYSDNKLTENIGCNVMQLKESLTVDALVNLIKEMQH